MQLQQNVSLYPYNTFHIHATAKYFAAFTTLNELQEALDIFYIKQYQAIATEHASCLVAAAIFYLQKI